MKKQTETSGSVERWNVTSPSLKETPTYSSISGETERLLLWDYWASAQSITGRQLHPKIYPAASRGSVSVARNPLIHAEVPIRSCSHAATRRSQACCSNSLFPSVFQIFYPETTDIYDRKNMPRCIYCIHALRYSLTLGPHLLSALDPQWWWSLPAWRAPLHTGRSQSLENRFLLGQWWCYRITKTISPFICSLLCL